MVKLSLLSVTLLVTGCHLCEAGPDDEQVLVQRAAVVQQEVEVHDLKPKESLERQALADNIHKLTAQVKETALKLRSGNNTVGVEGAVCTEQQLADYQKAVKDFAKKEASLDQAYVQASFANATRVIKQHFAPIYNAVQRMTKMTWSAVKPILRNSLQSVMFKALKPRQAYSASDVGMSLTKSEDEITKAVSGQMDNFIAIMNEELHKLDALLNSTVEEVPSADQLKALIRMSGPDMKWGADGKNDDIPLYMGMKVLPIVAADIFPVFAMPLALVNKIPKSQADFLPFAMNEVFPVLGQMSQKLSDMEAPYRANREDFPQRLCHTCQEKYVSGVNDIMTGCLSGCMSLLNTCVTAVDADCVQETKKCIECNTEHLISFDGCLNNATHARSIGKFQRITKMLGTATTPQSFDAFLDDLSQIIIDG
mmetsp:Transcript_93191/g.290545  ORF Transcript_93191/g.290545 Transcript_93191/m.290545 type:complete len:424 (+) Transcript_93191:66-1337(+)